MAETGMAGLGWQRQQPDIRSSRCDEKKAYNRLDVLPL
jgi:hypothetical protein